MGAVINCAGSSRVPLGSWAGGPNRRPVFRALPIKQGRRLNTTPPAGLAAVVRIVTVVAFLAECPQIIGRAILGYVVEVGDR